MSAERSGPAICNVSNIGEGKDEMTKASIDLQDLRRRIYVKSFGVKQMGARNAGNPHVACDVEGGWRRGVGRDPRAITARQPSTLPMSGVWKRSHGGTIEAPPDERGGNRYVLPNATAPHLDSTLFGSGAMTDLSP